MNGSISIKRSLRPDTLKLAVLYIVLLGGGLWHILGYFQTIMDSAAGPLMAVLALWLLYEQSRVTGWSVLAIRRLAVWAVIVFSGSLLVEHWGVATGLIFGTYNYGAGLGARVGHVPWAIGFAWINMLLASAAMTEKIFPASFKKPWLSALIIAAFMTLFDLFMEPAAMTLDYWQWENGIIPLQNYAAWFVLGFIFALAAMKLKIWQNGASAFGIHAYIAQLIYFLMVSAGGWFAV